MSNDGLERIDPVKITQPIQLLAIVLGVIVISLIYATIYLKDSYLAWIAIISAVAITVLVIFKFLSILEKNPYVFHRPQDYGPGEYVELIKSRRKDYNEDSLLASQEAKEEGKQIIEKDIVSLAEKNQTYIDPQIINDTILKLWNTWSVSVPTNADSYVYSMNSAKFESLVREALSELGIDAITHECQIGPYRIDVLIRQKDRLVPVEIKYYRKKVTGVALPTQLANQMKELMVELKTNESIIIVSSGVDNTAEMIFSKQSKPKKIHIVVGDNKEKLKEQLAKILL